VRTSSVHKVLLRITIKSFNISSVSSQTSRTSKLSRMVCFSTTRRIFPRWLNITTHSPPHRPRTSESRSLSCCKWPPRPPTTGTAYSEWNDSIPSEFPYLWSIPVQPSSPRAFYYPGLVHTGTDKRSSRPNSRLQDFTTWPPGFCRAAEYYPPISVQQPGDREATVRTISYKGR
jgi:hypothetical protein